MKRENLSSSVRAVIWLFLPSLRFEGRTKPCHAHVDGNETLFFFLMQEEIKKRAAHYFALDRFSRSTDDLSISRACFIVNCHISWKRPRSHGRSDNARAGHISLQWYLMHTQTARAIKLAFDKAALLNEWLIRLRNVMFLLSPPPPPPQIPYRVCVCVCRIPRSRSRIRSLIRQSRIRSNITRPNWFRWSFRIDRFLQSAV